MNSLAFIGENFVHKMFVLYYPTTAGQVGTGQEKTTVCCMSKSIIFFKQNQDFELIY